MNNQPIQPVRLAAVPTRHSEQNATLNTRNWGLTRFDVTALAVIVLLLAAIVATIMLADFTRPGPRVAYLAPADGAVQNIWMADPDDPANPRQVTFSPDGIYNFDVSPDGRYIAFAERNNNTGTTEIKLLDLHTGGLQPLTNCIAVDSDCKTPTWRPDGKVIAYERMDLNTDLANVNISPIRVWLIDLTTNPASTRPLFDDSQILGYSPQWSGDGNTIAVFDIASGGILVYDFLDGSIQSIPSRYGDVGSLSPDGNRLVFPEMIRQGNQMFARLKIANLSQAQFSDLIPPDEPVDDIMPRWNPDGVRLAIARQYIDDRWTRGHQIFLMDTADNTIEPLVVDEHYNSSFFQWNKAGTGLLMQRFPELTDTGEVNNFGRPEIWTYDLPTQKLVKVAVNGFQPRWVASPE